MREAATAAHQHDEFGTYINFNDLPAWQRRGVGPWCETYDRPGYDPIRHIEVTAALRRIHIECELPMKDEYRDLVERLAVATTSR